MGAWFDGITIETLRWPLTVMYLGLLALIATYGLHRYWLVLLYNRHRRTLPRPNKRFKALPRVTVQLPMYNEGLVAERVIDTAVAMEYPRDRVQFQVVDDSTDHSKDITRRRVAYWKERGVDIEWAHRTDRKGYKAGALAEATERATGELIAIFDADFLPPKSFLKKTVHYFADPKIGMVQTCWEHLNRTDSLLTRGQAIFLDGHFMIEHTARNRSGAWINFNGTAGMWRKATIDAAGGWHGDTLTEDVDLSYRAQLEGWKFLFLPWVKCPAELPPEINSFKSQQHRWTKGSIQVAIKLLPTLLKAKVSPIIKAEAFFHLTSPMVYLYITLFALLFFPVLFLNLQPVGQDSWLGVLLGCSLFALGTVSATTFYIASQRAQRKSFWGTLVQVPLLMAIGIGIALSNAVACIEALLGHQSEFVRTPKYNVGGTTGKVDRSNNSRTAIAKLVPIPSLKRSICYLELAMAGYMLYCFSVAISMPDTLVSIPFLLIFAAGYLYVGSTSLWAHYRVWRDGRRERRLAAAA